MTGTAIRAGACATLARIADGSAAVGLVLLAVDPATSLARGPLIGGFLAGLLSAPHILGPVVARALDRGRHPGRTLAAYFTAYAAALATTGLTVGTTPLAVPLLAATAAGACGPLLTGGLSSQLTTWLAGRTSRTDTGPDPAHAPDVRTGGMADTTLPAGPDRRATAEEDADSARDGDSGSGSATGTGTGRRSAEAAGVPGTGAETPRRVEALDSATYGAGGILGPVAVAACAGFGGARVAVLAVAGCALVAAVLAAGLPAAGTVRGEAGTGMGLRAVLAAMWRSVPLRRTTIGTCLTETAGGALPIAGALLAARLGHPARDVGVLVTALGAGALAGSLLVSVRPPRRLARTLPWCAAVIALAYAGAAFAPGYPPALACFALAGLADGPLLAATLDVRSRHAPAAGRARVFVTGAGLKIAAASLGAALAGVAAPLGARTILVLCAVVTALGVAAMRGLARG